MKTMTSTMTKLETDEGYKQFEEMIRNRTSHVGRTPLFTTNVEGLFETYLDGLPDDRRQHYNCNCCRRFIETYGGLVTIDLPQPEFNNSGGQTEPVFWTGSAPANWPEFFQLSIIHMRKKVMKAKVTGVFLSSEPKWGTAQNVPGKGSKYEGMTWTHLSAVAPYTFAGGILTADQKMAERKEEFGMLSHGLADYPMNLVEQAVRVLEADAVSRSEKALGIAKWFLELHQRIKDVKGELRKNLVWLTVATAPPGYCHVRSTMISTLLEDIKGGWDFSTIQKRWADKMHPLQYQRPTAPVSSGQIQVAEKLIETMGLASALRRRYATREDVDKITRPLWQTTPLVDLKSAKGGVFDHLRGADKKTVQTIELPPTNVSMEKFESKILPGALKLEVKLGVYDSMPFYGLLTAVDPDAKPIHQWDRPSFAPEAVANTVSHYFWHGGSMAGHWNLTAGWNEVSAVYTQPSTSSRIRPRCGCSYCRRPGNNDGPSPVCSRRPCGANCIRFVR